ncbi:hypothetical protein LWI28_025782 [Acer negundo]|uniref:glutathione transferase n=1 Tax=Acer negundo TaxID=4023 RepID=A0AAD5IGG3_ACENE|nr:hypothetical protein LWI28_025782 [Acer negundo]KAK4839097.1 hypothetical protein QYF36_019087 [Acer negundo]
MTSIRAEAKNYSLGGQKYSESRAIVRYYCNSGPDSVGTTFEEQARVNQWIEVEAHNFDELVLNIVYNPVVLPRLEQLRDSEQKLRAVFDVYEHRLSKSRYLAGESYSLADLSHLQKG